MDILIDGGIRRGSDIAKAVALGAKAVLMGRAPLYGVAAQGRQGVSDVLEILRVELETTLRLLGRPDVNLLGKDVVHIRRALDETELPRSEERRGGNEGVRTCKSGW